ncbi:MAG: hypothetical protein GX856_06890 [Gammaproteobacteria bacterium]|nr:hypothetical protein [Gammaproteobacteria bacterium]
MAWPEADFVVGNPPFIGNKRMRTALGDGYVEALRGAWPEVPESADFVMFWWHHAAQLTRRGAVERFGFITTNSIRQSFNRRVIEPHLADKKQPLSLVFAIPDHPWVDTADGAAVRIAMTVAKKGSHDGLAMEATSEQALYDGEVACEFRTTRGRLHADLRAGLALVDAKQLRANRGLAFTGMYPLGQGFVVLPEDETAAIGGDVGTENVLRPFVIARDLTQNARWAKVIDFYPRSAEQARAEYPSLFQWVLNRVKPERDQNPVEERRLNWWLFTRPVPPLRAALSHLSRYIVVPRTAKWFTFQFIDSRTVPDTSVVAIASPDSVQLGVLSSSVHLTWAIASGGTLEDRPRYQHQRTFNPFPFPDLHFADKFGGPITYALEDESGRPGEYSTIGEYPSDRIRNLAEQLDAHRKRQQAAHPGLTLTGMYNVLDKLRSGEVLTAKERSIHEQGLVSVLRQLHDELDEAVLYAYGWGDLLPLLRVAHGIEPPDSLQRLADADRDLPEHERRLHGGPATTREEAKRAFDETVLERLVALNAERAAEEARGHVRWLRPEFQNPDLAREREPEQARFADGERGDDTADAGQESAAAPVVKAQPWPKDTVDQVRAVADVLAASPVPLSLDEIAARCTARGPWKKRLPKLVEMLVALGRVQEKREKFGAR